MPILFLPQMIPFQPSFRQRDLVAMSPEQFLSIWNRPLLIQVSSFQWTDWISSKNLIENRLIDAMRCSETAFSSFLKYDSDRKIQSPFEQSFIINDLPSKCIRKWLILIVRGFRIDFEFISSFGYLLGSTGKTFSIRTILLRINRIGPLSFKVC